MEGERLAALNWGQHKPVTKHTPFIPEEFASMVEKGQWVVLPYLVNKRLLGLRLSLPIVKVERDRIPCWIIYYSYFKTNAKNLPVACSSSMQYSRALDRLLREIVFTDPALGPVYLPKADI